jgi:hypothetical protein
VIFLVHKQLSQGTVHLAHLFFRSRRPVDWQKKHAIVSLSNLFEQEDKMATFVPPSGSDLPDPSHRLREINDRLAAALNNLNEKQAEQPMLELQKLHDEYKETKPDFAEIVATILEFYDCIFAMTRSGTEEELRRVLGRLEKCDNSRLSESKEWLLGLNQQILLGRYRLRKLEAARILSEIQSLDEQQQEGFRELAQEAEPGSLERVTLEALLIYFEAIELLGRAATAQSLMELESAGAFLQQASLKFNRALETLNAIPKDSEIVKLVRGMTSGLDALAKAQEIYSSVLQKALTGGATADSLLDLERAERLFLKTGMDLQECATGWLRLTPQLAAVNFVAIGEQLSRVARNLRQLCFSALRPKSVAAQSAPRFFAFFMITFLVLLAGMRLSGLVAELNAGSLSGLLGMCLTVSSFSSFGLDGLRVVRASLVQKKVAAQNG